ncbi:serine hydrolase domain-containing protein [Fulvivirgaceae bacterium BMA12]|uniref:Serine hydrolase domain-containing protein n=1 Tax=Agaribacillus aureus TaxID=3051825 RepID=A0ABT8LAJ4_9BACT|nr:serine hydrolase domain-containing protein [Fulvivirgaceae bacterium BMA12]
MKNIFHLLLVGSLLISCKKEPELLIDSHQCNPVTVVANNHTEEEALQDLLNDYVANGIPGVAVVVDSKTKGFFLGVAGMTDIAAKVPMTSCHTFRVASLTKTFMGAAFMQLLETGAINLDDQISAILDDEILADLDKSDETTIAELLNHTSGIPNYDDNSRFVASVLNEPGKVLTVEDRLNFARELRGTPDWVIEKYEQIYSNTNYLLLQLILEKVTGKPYETYLSENITVPLGLRKTTFSTINTFPNGLSSGYCDMYDNGKLRDVNLFDANRWSGEASAISNAMDIYTFFNALITGQLIDPSAFENMKNNKYGLLIEEFDGIQAVGHDGQGIGYSSEMWYFPEKALTITLIANKGRIDDDQPSIQDFVALFLGVLSLH